MAPVLAGGVLLLIVGLQLVLPGDGPSQDIAGRAARRLRPVSPPIVQEYPDILASPIFAPDRRAGPAAEAADSNGASGASGDLHGYSALGAALGPHLGTVVVMSPTGVLKTLTRGEEIEGWRLTAVDRNQATFERDGTRRTLKIGPPTASTSPIGAMASPFQMARSPGGAPQ